MKNNKKEKIPYWQKEANSYFSFIHPKIWFEFLGWLITLSTLSYLSKMTNSWLIELLYLGSLVVLYMYTQRYLWTRKYQNFLPKFVSGKVRTLILYIIPLIGVTIVYKLGNMIVADITLALNLP